MSALEGQQTEQSATAVLFYDQLGNVYKVGTEISGHGSADKVDAEVKENLGSHPKIIRLTWSVMDNGLIVNLSDESWLFFPITSILFIRWVKP